MDRRMRRGLELGAAIYGWWWAANVALDYAIGRDPLWWIDAGPMSGVLLAYMMAIGSVISALGERINGRWRWSPLLRAVGMATMAAVMWILAIRGLSITLTAWGTYSALGALFTVAAWAALKDLGRTTHARPASCA